MSIKLLLDTDIGSDIDDALCLAYLLAQPRCELLGITTVTGEPEKRAAMASALCKVAGKDIAIFPGVERPLITPIQQPEATQASALAKWTHEAKFPQGEAIEFLRHTIRAYPGEVVLLGIGPLTNIALLFAIDPEIPTLLKQLVLMCGAYEQPWREWNALNDPYATAIVYRAPVTHFRAIGLDVTLKVKMDAAQFRMRCNTPLLHPVLDFAEIWFQGKDTITFHDPLAATTLFSDDICTYTVGDVNVELKDEQEAGRLYWRPRVPGGTIEVATDVQPERFFAQYFSVF